jgi:hypothetical protein
MKVDLFSDMKKKGTYENLSSNQNCNTTLDHHFRFAEFLSSMTETRKMVLIR